MSTDLTFITNEKDANLLDRFNVLIKGCQAFDVLVGYFFASGFYALRPALEGASSIRILVGISTNKDVLAAVKASNQPTQQTLSFSHTEVKQSIEPSIISEFEQSEDSRRVEDGISAFITWLKSGKLQVKAYPSQNIHAKLYIVTFPEGDRDVGRVITGSSNFTQAGLIDNLEFNVELKNRADYEFALNKFNELWNDAVDISEKYLEIIHTRTWLNDTITPYQLYLKFLYEYFKDELSQSEDLFFRYIPENFLKLDYQEQAVLSAKRILEEYGGVFVSDVVGLGKTFICALLANQLGGRHLVIAPPVLLDKTNPGSWPNVFRDFNIPATYESLGKLDKIISTSLDKFDNVFIDEAHRFRNEDNATYEKLARICRGKRVILVTATPYNNYPRDILSQIKLFQSGKRSTIPNLSNLEAFFGNLQKRVKDLDRQKDRELYMRTMKEIAREVREKVLKYLMVRRTRSEIVEYFGKDLISQSLKFPNVSDPEALYYELDEQENAVFDETIRLIASTLSYARYTPKLYLKKPVDQLERQSQANMGALMKILLVKRLDSSIHAFRMSIERFIASYSRFIKMLDSGKILIGKRYAEKIFELFDNDDDEAIQHLIEDGDVEQYTATDFKPEFKELLRADLSVLERIRDMWSLITQDAKLIAFAKKLASSRILRKQKLLVFTESKETAFYLGRELGLKYPGEVLVFTGGSSTALREKVIENFDAKASPAKDDYRILVTTEVLSEGVNLHRSNVVINYDIPWNPTRMMQRVGRVNRVDTQFDTIYSYTFFPTKQSNDQIKLKEAAEAKIHAFISMLGSDSRLLLEGEEIESHELFNRLLSKSTIVGDEDEESELRYLKVIKDIRDNDPDLFEQIKRLPKKVRTARSGDGADRHMLTYFRKGPLQKFFLATLQNEPVELDFMQAAMRIEAAPNTPRAIIGEDFHDMLAKNKNAFDTTIDMELTGHVKQGSKSNSAKILAILKTFKRDMRAFTEDQEQYFKLVMARLESGDIPRQTAKQVHAFLQQELKKEPSALKVIAVLKRTIPPELLEDFAAEKNPYTAKPREVILSEYFQRG